MINRIFLILSCLACSSCFSQSIRFSKPDPQPNLIDVYGGDFASGDLDGDGDQDLMILGIPNNTKLYFNDGMGDFEESLGTPFPKTGQGNLIFRDFDGDSDLDLFYSGKNGVLPDFTFIGDFSFIYLNDGSGSFTQNQNEGISDTVDGRVVAGDLDNDGDEDVIISATDIYLNNGNASFTLVPGALPSPALEFSVSELADLDNDGDLDIVVSGEQPGNLGFMGVYLNDGTANFTFSTDSPFIQFKANDLDAGDLDGDGNVEILVTGLDESNSVRSIIYRNNGDGSFIQSFGYSVTNLFAGTNTIADLDNDGDNDLILIGSQNGGLPNIYGFIYENNGSGLAPVELIGGEYIANNIVNDFNGDGLLDIVVQGFVDDTNLYFNTTGAENSISEVACMGDFNGDGMITITDLSGFLSQFGTTCE
ncbi:MAG: FG-GAP repeat domain-containing protein [Flavobacteriales bacterium]